MKKNKVILFIILFSIFSFGNVSARFTISEEERCLLEFTVDVESGKAIERELSKEEKEACLKEQKYSHNLTVETYSPNAKIFVIVKVFAALLMVVNAPLLIASIIVFIVALVKKKKLKGPIIFLIVTSILPILYTIQQIIMIL